MTAQATGVWYEVQGLTLCPANDHPNTHCSVPDEGEWLPIYFLSTAYEMRAAFQHVLDSDDPIYDRYEDFRMAEPVEKVAKAKRRKAA